MSSEHLEHARQRLAEGATFAEVAQELDVKASTLRSACRRAGIRSTRQQAGRQPGAGRPAALSEEQVRALVAQAQAGGWSQRRTAQEAEVHPRTLKGLLVRYGVPWWR